MSPNVSVLSPHKPCIDIFPLFSRQTQCAWRVSHSPQLRQFTNFKACTNRKFGKSYFHFMCTCQLNVSFPPRLHPLRPQRQQFGGNDIDDPSILKLFNYFWSSLSEKTETPTMSLAFYCLEKNWWRNEKLSERKNKQETKNQNTRHDIVHTRRTQWNNLLSQRCKWKSAVTSLNQFCTWWICWKYFCFL